MKPKKPKCSLTLRCEPLEGAEGFYPFTKRFRTESRETLYAARDRFVRAWEKANGCTLEEHYRITPSLQAYG